MKVAAEWFLQVTQRVEDATGDAQVRDLREAAVAAVALATRKATG